MENEETIGAAITSTWRVVGAAVQGGAHQKQGLPCQDAQDYRVLPAGELLIALADGAGTAARAEEGARCAVEQALQSLSTALEAGPPEENMGWEELVLSAFVQARQALLRLSDEAGEPMRLFATTLTCAIAACDRLVVGQVGDGVVVAQDSGGELFVVALAQRGEYANETYFLTQEDALEHIQVRVLDQPVSALAVMSDGLIRLALRLPSHAPYPPFFQPLFAFAAAIEDERQAVEQLAGFLSSERVCARTDDDKSLVLAVR
jgi:hypothetical protein